MYASLGLDELTHFYEYHADESVIINNVSLKIH